jgi:ElaB/YqjD/DUF883 family membrane-anchored ribosome-binding protein
MSHGTKEMKQEIQKGIQMLEALFDEIELKLHLAGMDARDAWKEVRGQAEKAAREASVASKHALDDSVRRVKEFRESIQAAEGHI